MIIVCPHCGVVFDVETSNEFQFSDEDLQQKKEHGLVGECPTGCALTQSEIDAAIKVKGTK